MAFYVDIVASKRNGTLYIGSTDRLSRRVWEHREKVRPGFTAKYDVATLVWYRAFDTRAGAFKVERQMKEWNRAWKLELIERFNPAGPISQRTSTEENTWVPAFAGMGGG